ncbi:MAG: hypothetical protein AB1801_12685 [Chloroflexota bacterium]
MLWKNKKGERPPTDYRRTRRNQERTLLVLVILVLVIVGAGLIGLIWGIRPALFGGICLLGGAGLISGLWLLLSLIQKWVDEDE